MKKRPNAFGIQVRDVRHPHVERQPGWAGIGGRTEVTMADWRSLTYVVVDVEGDGHQPPDLVELAAVPIVGGIIGEPTTWLVQPDQPITYFATRIHGLTDQDVEDAPTFAAIKDAVLAALEADAFVAHNAHVDVSVLSRQLGDWKPPEVFDTLKLSRRLLPDAGGYELGALVERFKLAEGLPEGLTPHRADYDALVAARLFVRLAADATTLEALRGDPPGGSTGEALALF
jgi:DNA polymerase III epsilon subunit-like protein